jgi:hypothetical protein
MEFRDIGGSGMKWIDLVQDRGQWMALVNTVMKLKIPKKCPKFLSKCATCDFSRKAQLRGVT